MLKYPYNISSINLFLFLFLFLFIHPFFGQAQKKYSSSNGQIIMVNRMDENRTKTLRTDKPLTIRTINGLKVKGMCFVEDNTTIICGSERISFDSIYSINGLVARNSKEKVFGVGLGVISAGAAIYPLYLIVSGFGLGDGNALFVGFTLLSFDLLIMYAAASLAGIYPRRFNIMNWGIRMEPPVQELLYIPNEVRGYN
jgi:hypothetical protein